MSYKRVLRERTSAWSLERTTKCPLLILHRRLARYDLPLLPPPSKVRGLLAGTFNELVKAVALAADDADDDGHAGDHKCGGDLGDGGVSTEETIDGNLHGQGGASAAAAAARVVKAAGDSVEGDGEVRCYVPQVTAGYLGFIHRKQVDVGRGH